MILATAEVPLPLVPRNPGEACRNNNLMSIFASLSSNLSSFSTRNITILCFEEPCLSFHVDFLPVQIFSFFYQRENGSDPEIWECLSSGIFRIGYLVSKSHSLVLRYHHVPRLVWVLALLDLLSVRTKNIATMYPRRVTCADLCDGIGIPPLHCASRRTCWISQES